MFNVALEFVFLIQSFKLVKIIYCKFIIFESILISAYNYQLITSLNPSSEKELRL